MVLYSLTQVSCWYTICTTKPSNCKRPHLQKIDLPYALTEWGSASEHVVVVGRLFGFLFLFGSSGCQAYFSFWSLTHDPFSVFKTLSRVLLADLQ